MNPRTEALAFRIWQHCEPKGWDCTSQEIAEALDEPRQRVISVMHWKGWSWKLRRTKRAGVTRLEMSCYTLDPMNQIHSAMFSRHDPRGMDG